MDRKAPGNAGSLVAEGADRVAACFGHATLACILGREFNIRFNIDELMALENVREIIRIVRLKLGGQRPDMSSAVSVAMMARHHAAAPQYCRTCRAPRR